MRLGLGLGLTIFGLSFLLAVGVLLDLLFEIDLADWVGFGYFWVVVESFEGLKNVVAGAFVVGFVAEVQISLAVHEGWGFWLD